MKNLVLIVLALIAGGIGYLKWSAGQTAPQLTSPAPSAPTPVVSPDPTASWERWSTDNFELAYPPEATTAAVESGIDTKEWRVIYMGDIQKASGRTQTELWDGYAVTVTRFEGPDEISAQAQAETERQGIIDACSEENAGTIQAGKVGTITTVYYHGGCLGTADHHYFVHQGVLYRITAMIAQPENQKLDYTEITSAILSSFVMKSGS